MERWDEETPQQIVAIPRAIALGKAMDEIMKKALESAEERENAKVG